MAFPGYGNPYGMMGGYGGMMGGYGNGYGQLPITSALGNGQGIFQTPFQGSLVGAYPNQYLGPGFTFGTPQSEGNLALLFATAGTTAPNLAFDRNEYFPPFLTSNVTGIDFFNNAVTNPSYTMSSYGGYGGGYGGYGGMMGGYGGGYGGYGGMMGGYGGGYGGGGYNPYAMMM